MYATGWCPYCARARRLLEDKGVEFEEIDVEARPEARTEMVRRSGRRTVPQIFVGDTHVGGSDDLHALDASGGLDRLLAGSDR
jgi:glutaredoxin 3